MSWVKEEGTPEPTSVKKCRLCRGRNPSIARPLALMGEPATLQLPWGDKGASAKERRWERKCFFSFFLILIYLFGCTGS